MNRDLKTVGPPRSTPLAKGARLHRPGLDDLSRIRYVLSSCLRTISGVGLTDEELQGFLRLINTPAYTDKLAEMVMDERLLALMVGDEIVASAGWHPSPNTPASARFDHVCALALFGRSGLGSRIVTEVERDALLAGYHRMSIRTLLDQIPFFERLGYVLTSHGAMLLSPSVAVPVAFMRKSAPPPKPGRSAAAKPH